MGLRLTLTALKEVGGIDRRIVTLDPARFGGRHDGSLGLDHRLGRLDLLLLFLRFLHLHIMIHRDTERDNRHQYQ